MVSSTKGPLIRADTAKPLLIDGINTCHKTQNCVYAFMSNLTSYSQNDIRFLHGYTCIAKQLVKIDFGQCNVTFIKITFLPSLICVTFTIGSSRDWKTSMALKRKIRQETQETHQK